jgi:hypothetical protein
MCEIVMQNVNEAVLALQDACRVIVSMIVVVDKRRKVWCEVACENLQLLQVLQHVPKLGMRCSQ